LTSGGRSSAPPDPRLEYPGAGIRSDASSPRVILRA
jgi:hypothetical protein